MKQAHSLADITAISLSTLCTIHCLALPILMVLMPNIAALQLDNENFHVWMVIVVIPTSLFALTVGCDKHKRYQFLGFGIVGILCLISALFVGSETWETGLTVLGSFIIALSHYNNYRLCKKQESHDCDSHQNA